MDAEFAVSLERPKQESVTMARKDRDGNGNRGSDRDDNAPVGGAGRKPTRDDLTNVIAAAKEAAHSAEAAADAALAVVEGGGLGPAGSGEVIATLSDQDVAEAPMAFEAFMGKLGDVLKRAGESVRVTELEGWIKIEGKQGHKVYITKTKTVVNRVESTLDPDLIKGATPMAGNGRIASVLPPNTRAVGEAIKLLATLAEPIRPPARGGARQD